MALYPPANVDTYRPIQGLALCAGFGGLELGLSIAEPRHRTVCYVERETYPAATLVARMEDQSLDHAPVWSDLKTFNGRPWRGKVDILTAGYPCQPFTFSGLRQGAADPRHLWPDVARVIEEVQPHTVFCENVEGHLSLGFSEVASNLQDMGFSVKAGLFSAYEVGAAHQRRRLFMLAHANHAAKWQSGRTSIQGQRSVLAGKSQSQRFADRIRRGSARLGAALACNKGRRFQTSVPPKTYPFSRPLHLSLRFGTRALPGELTFNPHFSDWLMGWPIGWSDPKQPVTELSHWLRHSRTALLNRRSRTVE